MGHKNKHVDFSIPGLNILVGLSTLRRKMQCFVFLVLYLKKKLFIPHLSLMDLIVGRGLMMEIDVHF